MGEAKAFRIFARGNCVALVYSPEAGPASLGSTGIMTGKGLACLVWRGGQAVLVSKGSEVPAEAADVQAIRQFSEDLKAALGLGE